MTDINRMRLFPAVFTVTPDAESKLPSNWGEPCVQLVTAATATLAAINFQVSFIVQMYCQSTYFGASVSHARF